MSVDVPILRSNFNGDEERTKGLNTTRKEDRSTTPTKRRGSTSSKASHGERSSTPMKRRGSVPKLQGDRSLTPNTRRDSKPTLKSFERATVASSARARCYPAGQTGLSASRTELCSGRSPSSERLEASATKRTRSVEPCVRSEVHSSELNDNLQRIDEGGHVETIADAALERSEALLAGLRALGLTSTSPEDSPRKDSPRNDSPCSRSQSMRRLGATLVDSNAGCHSDSIASKRRMPSDAYEGCSVVDSTMSTADSMTSFPCLDLSSSPTGTTISSSVSAPVECQQRRRHSLDSSFSGLSSCGSICAPVQRAQGRRHSVASLPVFSHTPPPSPRQSVYGQSLSSVRSQQYLGAPRSLEKHGASMQQRPKTHVVRTTVKEVIREIVTVTDVYTVTH